jgi:hypothetical protein
MDAAVVPPLDRRRIRHMVEMPMGQQQRVDFGLREVPIRALRRVDEHVPGRSAQKKSVRIEEAAGKFFELNHGKAVFSTCAI